MPRRLNLNRNIARIQPDAMVISINRGNLVRGFTNYMGIIWEFE